MTYTTRCGDCSALQGEGAKSCRRCGRTNLVALDDEAARMYPQLKRTERGYEGPSRTQR